MADGELEEWAIEILRQSLAATQDAFEVVGFPDRVERRARAVDFEVSVGGRDVALEVTRLAPGRRLTQPAWACLQRVAKRYAESGRASEFGWLLLSAMWLEPPRKTETREIADRIFTMVMDEAPSLTSGSDRKDVVVEGLPQMRRLALARIGDRPLLSFTQSVQGTGGRLSGIAKEWVANLLVAKTTQAVGYSEVWMLIIDDELIVDGEDVSAALVDRIDELPENWRRFFWIPATDRSSAVELKVRPGTTRTALAQQ